MMNVLKRVYPSIYSANHLYLYDECKKVEDHGFETLHVDIQDGICSSEISFGIKVLKGLRTHSKMIFDIHLMLMDVEAFLPKLADMDNVAAITFHPKDVRYPARVITKIKAMGYEAGLAFTLNEALDNYEVYADQVSSILICTAEVDGKMNQYNTYSTKKIRQARVVFPHAKIVVDGNIHQGNIKEMIDAGTDCFVMGREIFDCDNLDNKINELKQLL